MFELFLVTNDDATQRAVAQILERESPGSARLHRARDWSELEGALARRPVSLVLVDLSSGSSATFERFEPLIRRARQTAFVFVCDDLHVDLVLKAMQIGARHCLMRKKLTAELPPLLARLREDGSSATPAGEGQVVTVLGAGGGCGATTVAINLAEELRPHGIRVGVLVAGAVDTPLWDSLGGSPPRDKMLRPEDVARAAVLMAALPPHASLEELTLLPAGAAPDDPGNLFAGDAWRAVIDRLRKTYDEIYVDLPPVLPFADAAAAAANADGVIVVIRNAETRAELVEEAVGALAGAPMLGCVLTGLWIFALFEMFDTRAIPLILLALILDGIFQDLQYGPQAAVIAENFPASRRYTGSGLGYHLAAITAGGPAPIIAASLFRQFESSFAIALFAMATTLISLATLPFLKERAGELDRK